KDPKVIMLSDDRPCDAIARSDKIASMTAPPNEPPVSVPPGLALALRQEVGHQIDFCRRATALARKIAPALESRQKDRMAKLTLGMVARSITASDSLTILFESGLNADAQGAARTIVELAIDLRYIATD